MAVGGMETLRREGRPGVPSGGLEGPAPAFPPVGIAVLVGGALMFRDSYQTTRCARRPRG
jgi:hypothetical protein